MHPKALFQGRRVTQTQSSVKASLKAGYAQMNDWSRLAVDPKTTQRLEAEKRTARIQIRSRLGGTGHVLSGSVSYQTLRREERRGQLRLSLTNTYYEWPVKGPGRKGHPLQKPCAAALRSFWNNQLKAKLLRPFGQ